MEPSDGAEYFVKGTVCEATKELNEYNALWCKQRCEKYHGTVGRGPGRRQINQYCIVQPRPTARGWRWASSFRAVVLLPLPSVCIFIRI